MKKTVPQKQSTSMSFRFRAETIAKLDALSKKTGLNRNSVISLAIMEMAERRGV